jgi:hypothetical protein
MDMLEQGQWSEDLDKNVQYSGWSSSYSVQLVLVQLQVCIRGRRGEMGEGEALGKGTSVFIKF